MGDVPSGGSTSAANASTAELVQRATEQISGLVREEIGLVRAELTAKGRRAGVGAGLFGGGGMLALFGAGALIAAVAVALSYVMPAAVAALVVGVVLLLAAAVLARSGKKQVSRAMPPVPESARDSLRADAGTVRDAARNRGRG